MPDTPTVVHIGENSPEQVAWKLMMLIAALEEKKVPGAIGGHGAPDREWLLDTYAECLDATQGQRNYQHQ